MHSIFYSYVRNYSPSWDKVETSVQEKLHHVTTGEYRALAVYQAGERASMTLVLIAGAILLFCIPSFPQDTSSDGGSSAGELLRRVIDTELKAQAEDHSHWMYRLQTHSSGNEQVKLVVETKDGDLDRLESVNGRPINAEQQKTEDHRIAGFLQQPDERKKRRHAQEEDDRQTEHLFKTLPAAVIATYGEHKGDLVEILFQPNPNFHPSSHEDAVFHEMAGKIWIDQKENRLAGIEGRLIRDVKFGGGLLGHLDQGGEFYVKQSEVAPGHWEITLMHVNMNGKVLFFKTIAVQDNEIRTNFQRVADNLTLAEAAQELQRHSTSPTKSAAVEMHPLPTGSQITNRN
jgi:hypothetical protein